MNDFDVALNCLMYLEIAFLINRLILRCIIRVNEGMSRCNHKNLDCECV